MKYKYRVSDAEEEVLEMLWTCGGPIKQSELFQLFEEQNKKWKRQTLNTLIVRLEEKGFVKREDRVVEPVFGKDEFHQLQLEEQIDDFYNGKWSNFFAAFARYQKISAEEAEEIVKIIQDNT